MILLLVVGCDGSDAVRATIHTVHLRDRPTSPVWIGDPTGRRERLDRDDVHLDLREGLGMEAEFRDEAGRLGTTLLRPGRHIVVILPAQWTITDGPFAGQVLPTRILLANDRVTATVLRPEMPLPTSFPRSVGGPNPDTNGGGESSRRDPGATRSALRRAIDGINEVTGISVFRYDTVAAIEPDVRIRTVRRLQASLASTRISAPPCPYRKDLGFACQPRWIDHADVTLSDAAGVAEIQHELLHAVGLSHTCVVPSVMATEFSEADLKMCGLARGALGLEQPLRLERGLGPYDVAAIEIVRQAAGALADLNADYIHWVITHPRTGG